MNAAKELEFASATLSYEMTLPQIRDISKAVPAELIAYGRMPLMVTEHCLIRNRTGECTCHLGAMKLTDKTGAEFPVIKDGKCAAQRQEAELAGPAGGPVPAGPVGHPAVLHHGKPPGG